MKKESIVAALMIAASASTFGTAARADDDPSAIAAARTIGTDGLKLAEAGNCKAALEKLDRAEKLHHAPTTLAKLGECNVQLGHLVLGAEQLRRAARETLPSDAPAPFRQARARAQKLLDETAPRIAQLQVNVTLPAGMSAQVTIDGEPIPAALLDVDRPTDPGSHVVEATAAGYRTASQSVTLKDGERTVVRLAPEAEPAAAPVSPPPSSSPPVTSAPIVPDPPPEAPPTNQRGTLRLVGWSLIGIGAAGVVTGIVAGALAIGTKGDLEGECDASRRCDPDQQGRIDRLRREAAIGTTGFIVGGVGLAGGAALLLFGSRSAGSVKAATALGGLSVGLGSVGYRGAF